MFDVDKLKGTERLFKIENFLFYQRLPSTQDRAKELIKTSSARQGYVVITDEQYRGRGRFGRTWKSTQGASLTFSLIVEKVPLLSMRTALSLLETLEDLCGIKGEIRWPNDVVVNGKKICGILIEIYKPLAVVGIGLNVNETTPPFSNATSIRLETGKSFSREPILSCFLQRFEYNLHIEGTMDILRGRLSFIDSYVEIETEGGTMCGEFFDLGEEGEMLIRTESGTIKGLLAGEVKKIRELNKI